MAIAININGVSEDALNLKNMLDGTLERIQSIYQSYNVPLPKRQYWTMGTPVIDGEQVVVSLHQIYLGPPGAQITTPQRCNNPRSATLSISVAREVPVVGMNGRPPTADKLQEAAAISAVDAWVLMQSVQLFDQWDGGYGIGVIATVEALDVEGGFQVVNMEITMTVP
jgi:hypothetical protein